jgi:formamidopyrimidine-DNA glycosylase
VPELPEIETIASGLRRSVVGRCFTDFATRQPKAINLPPDAFRQRVRQRVDEVRRLGKYAILRLDHDSLWLHMGLSGQVLVEPAGCPGRETAPMILLTLDDGSRMRLERIFMGHAHLLDPQQSAARESELGPDALSPEVTVDLLSTIARSKAGVGVKALLMDQSILAGLGNAYSDEVLHRAGIHPERKMGSLGSHDIESLQAAITATLQESIAAGGDESYTDVGGVPGRYTSRVHGRKTCAICEGPVQKRAFGGRTAFFCPLCQH